MRGVTKRFPGVVANDDVSFEVARGEVHALLGENGAGKTTLMNVLTGLYRPDEGKIEVGGRPVELHSPRDAIAAGIGMVHQHFRLVETLTVAENIALADRQAPFLLRGRGGRAAGRADGRSAPHAGRSGREDLAALGRRAAACGDHEGGQERLPRADPRRADGGVDAAGGAGALPHAPRDGRRGPLGRRHHAQASRGDGGRRPRDRPARRAVDRNRQDIRSDAERARVADGRAGRRARAAARAGRDRRGGSRGAGAFRARRPRRRRAAGRLASPYGPARCSASPGSLAMGSASSPRC